MCKIFRGGLINSMYNLDLFDVDTLASIRSLVSFDVVYCEQILCGGDNKVFIITNSLGNRFVFKYYTKRSFSEAVELVEIGKELQRSGIPSPVFHKAINSNHGTFIIMDFVEGKMPTNPKQISSSTWVELFSQLSSFSPNIILSQKNTPPRTISDFKKFIKKYPSKYSRLLDDLEDVYSFIPDNLYVQNTFCHGDVSLSNVLVSNRKIVAVLDHDHYYLGNVIDDISRALMFIAFPKMGDQLVEKKFIESLLSGYIKKNNLSQYGITPKTIIAWSLVHICFMTLNTDYYDHLEQRDSYVRKSYTYSANEHQQRFYKLREYLYNQH